MSACNGSMQVFFCDWSLFLSWKQPLNQSQKPNYANAVFLEFQNKAEAEQLVLICFMQQCSLLNQKKTKFMMIKPMSPEKLRHCFA